MLGRRRALKTQEKEKDRRPILYKLCAALLRSFRGQHGKNWFEESARGIWDPWEGNPTQPKRGRGPHQHAEI